MRAAGARAERQWERLRLFEVETGVGLGSVWDQKGSERDRFGTALGPGFLSRSWRELAEAPAGPGVEWRRGGPKHFFRCYAFGVRLHLELKANVERRTPNTEVRSAAFLPPLAKSSASPHPGPLPRRGDETRGNQR